ncbi:hypothetical protein [Gluconobacter japonicus]|uniref:hypothetical protein n=1 Tax=Gluconobacter japonicus TaxID=376620 RepID=UPI000782A01C|nr:hypothetical protein [Gluconobacter japonicus]KXV20054.1 hypothetical protein AD935_13375 [Gluconobacter japonicus]
MKKMLFLAASAAFFVSWAGAADVVPNHVQHLPHSVKSLLKSNAVPTHAPGGLAGDNIVMGLSWAPSLIDIVNLADYSVQQADIGATVAGLNGSGGVTSPSVTVLTLPGTGGTVSPSDTDTTLYTLTPSAAGTIAFGPGVGAGHQKIIELLIVQPASSGVPIELSGPISWPNGAAPIVSSMPGDRTFIRFLTTDGGQTYIGGI